MELKIPALDKGNDSITVTADEVLFSSRPQGLILLHLILVEAPKPGSLEHPNASSEFLLLSASHLPWTSPVGWFLGINASALASCMSHEPQFASCCALPDGRLRWGKYLFPETWTKDCLMNMVMQRSDD